MAKEQKAINRYSLGFKQKVVRELEREGLTLAAVKRRYAIGGDSTIQRWVKRFGKNDLLNKIVRIEMKDEKDRVKELEAEVRRLKIALADATMGQNLLGKLVEIAGEHYNTDLKKTFGPKLSGKAKKK